MAAVALGRLGLLDSPAPVVLGGSILAARRPGLDAGVRGELGRRAPLAEVRVVEAAPVLGAVLLGMDAVGAGVGAYERVRGWFG